MAQLRVISEVLRDLNFALSGDYFTIGRLEDNSIRLAHSSVSKHHAMLKRSGEEYLLLDLHSTNGVVVNGRRDVVHHLHDGDRILLGDVQLRFERQTNRATQPLNPLASPGD